MRPSNLAEVTSSVDRAREKTGDRVRWSIMRDRDDTGSCVYARYDLPDETYITTYEWISDEYSESWIEEKVREAATELSRVVGEYFVLGVRP